MNSTLLQKLPTIKVVRGADEPGERSEFESELRQLCAQHFQSLPRRDSLAWMLSEACFTVANDFDLTRYMMWPLVEDANDPYRPYFELWRCGGILRFENAANATIYTNC